ncbi:MAG: chemotaxis protein CheW [Rubrivivax sp.]|nr:chemotaxis protein CheW [Rubrivivax sp.]
MAELSPDLTMARRRGAGERPVRGDASAAAHGTDRLAGQAIRCGRLSLAWPEGVARAVIDCPPLSAVPHAARWLAGAAHIDGRIVPVLDLAAWFVPGGPTSSAGSSARLLLLGDGDETSAILFEGLPREVQLTAADPGEALGCEPALSPFVIGYAEDDPATWMLDHLALMQALQARLGEGN